MNIVMAHPDDEVIFGCAVLKDADRIVCVASDENNIARVWCKDRKKALQDIGKMLGIETICFDYNSEFYRHIEPRSGGLVELEKKLLPYLSDTVFTHNAWGEYGHIDHILVNQIVNAHCRYVMTTDACLFAEWFNVKRLHQGSRKETIDMDLYNRCKAIYDKYGCWTWSKEPIKEVRIHVADNSHI